MRKHYSQKRRYTRTARLPRSQSVWVPGPLVDQGALTNDPSLITAGGSIMRLVSWNSIGLKTTASGLLMQGQASSKLLRFDGFIELFLDPNYDATASGAAIHDMTRVRYVWYRSKLSPNAYGGAEAQLASTAGPMDNVEEWMRRKDVLKQGVVYVRGPVPSTDVPLPYTTGVTTSGGAHAFVNTSLFVQKRCMENRPVCHLPLPRLPKGGLNLLEGESLECFVQGYAMTDVMSNAYRDVYAASQLRLLLSA